MSQPASSPSKGEGSGGSGMTAELSPCRLGVIREQMEKLLTEPLLRRSDRIALATVRTRLLLVDMYTTLMAIEQNKDYNNKLYWLWVRDKAKEIIDIIATDEQEEAMIFIVKRKAEQVVELAESKIKQEGSIASAADQLAVELQLLEKEILKREGWRE